MRKRGISPLIATVLIIGFTVALAAVIMTWGQSFIKGMQERTAESTEAGLICAQDVKVDVQNACNESGDFIKVTIANDGTKDITKYAVRVYKSAAKVGTVEFTETISAFGIATKIIGLDACILNPDGTCDGKLLPSADWPAGILEGIKAVEVVPTISIEGIETTCTASADKFGNEAGEATIKECA